MKLTNKNYFSKEANAEYMSNSQYKGFLDCEAKGLEMSLGYWNDFESFTDREGVEVEVKINACIMAGKYVHAWNEGRLDEFKAENISLFTNKGELKAPFVFANKIIEVIKKDPMIMIALSGEKEKLITFDMFGCKWKILIDSFFEKEKRFADLKVLKDITKGIWNGSLKVSESVFTHRGYYTQMAIYAEGVRLFLDMVEGDYFEPFIAAVTKENPPDKGIISFASLPDYPIDSFISQELCIVEKRLPRILEIKSGEGRPAERCEVCNFCRYSKKLTGTIFYSNFESKFWRD